MGDKNPHNSIKKQVIPKQSYLSDDLIIEEILTRLPVKSLLRFKSVSKQWYSTLSSSDFANAHLFRSPLSHPSAPVNTLFIKRGHNYYLFSYDDDQISGNFEDNLVKLDVEFGAGKDYLELIGCCNGLVCLTPASHKYFIIWNPATRKLHKYRSNGYFKRISNPNKGDYCYEAYGFGYASSIDDYKYVRILTVFGETGDGKYSRTNNIVHVFSLKENKWRKIDFNHDVIAPYGRAVLINEKLYWAAGTSGDSQLVVSFDLGVESFDIINFNLDRYDYLGVMGGCLSKCNYDGFIGDKLLYILEPPSVVKSIGLSEGLRFNTGSQIIGFTRTGKFFVTGPYHDEQRDVLYKSLGIIDTRMKPIQYTMVLRFDKSLNIARYVPSLVSPFCH